MNPEEFDTTASFPTADMVAQTDGGDKTIHIELPVKIPDKDKNDYIINIRGSELKGWREKLAKLKEKPFPWAEVYLAASSSGFGASLSSLLSEQSIGTTKGIIFFVLIPILATAGFAAYLHLRKLETVSATFIADILLEEMPNMKDSGEKNS